MPSTADAAIAVGKPAAVLLWLASFPCARFEPPGGEVVALMVSKYKWLAVTNGESFALNGLPAAVVGVPVIVPALTSMFSPPGSPVADQV